MKTTKKLVHKNSFLIVSLTALLLIGHSSFSQQTERVFLSLTEFTVKTGHNFQFREGVKAWKACYIENEGTWQWDVWSRVQGEGNVYGLTSVMLSWAEMDEVDEAGRKCSDISRELINPHIESSSNSITSLVTDFSKSVPFSSEDNVVWVTYWRVDSGVNFREAVKEVSDAVRASEGDVRSYWYSSVGGGPDHFHYFAVTPYKNFAALDQTRENVWTILENAKGKMLRDQTQEKFRNSIENSWSYIYTLVEDLSRR